MALLIKKKLNDSETSLPIKTKPNSLSNSNLNKAGA